MGRASTRCFIPRASNISSSTPSCFNFGRPVFYSTEQFYDKEDEQKKSLEADEDSSVLRFDEESVDIDQLDEGGLEEGFENDMEEQTEFNNQFTETSQEENISSNFSAPVSGTPGKKTGTVKWFDTTKGYGFIATPDGPDVFVHQTSILMEGFRSLEDGEAVEFDIVEDRGRIKAANVTGPNGARVRGRPRPTAF